MFKALKIVKNLNFFALLGVVVFIAIAVLASLGSLTEITAYTQGVAPSLPTGIFGDPIVGDRDQLIETIVNIAQTIIFIFAAACVLIIIWGGIQWGISGTEDGSKNGKQIIQNGITGLIIAALAFLFIRIVFGIIQFVLGFFGNGNN